MRAPLIMLVQFFFALSPARADTVSVTVQAGQKVIFDASTASADALPATFRYKGETYVVTVAQDLEARKVTVDVLHGEGFSPSLVMGIRLVHGGETGQAEMRKGKLRCTVTYAQ